MAQAAGSQASDKERLQNKLELLVREISSDLAGLEAAESKEVLSDFVSELFLRHAEQCRQVQRKQKQAAGIAAAKARGVRFGRPGAALPEGFDDARSAWREGRLPLRQAADACGMTKSAFYNAVMRREQREQPAV